VVDILIDVMSVKSSSEMLMVYLDLSPSLLATEGAVFTSGVAEALGQQTTQGIDPVRGDHPSAG
jgi:hypothetical protein